jgi:hypothetical protein
MLCLKLDESAFRALCTGDAHGVALNYSQCLHHPVGEVSDAFLSDELKGKARADGGRMTRFDRSESEVALIKLDILFPP